MIKRFNCTKENPWKPGDGSAVHFDAEFIEYIDNGDTYISTYRCRNCKLGFSEEIQKGSLRGKNRSADQGRSDRKLSE